MNLSKRVAFQWFQKQALNLNTVLQDLRDLHELSDNLDEIESQFSQTFKMANMDPTVESQLDVLRKAREGLKQAQATFQALESILQLYPEDKTAQRAIKDASTMVARFKRHEDEAHKIITRLSKKSLPPALKKMSAALHAALQKHLVNPDDLRINWWQHKHTLSQGVGTGIQYAVLFRMPNLSDKKLDGVGLCESTLFSGVYQVFVRPGGYELPITRETPTTVQEQVNQFLKVFRGDPRIQGEEARSKTRRETAERIFTELKAVWKRLYGIYDTDRSSDGLQMEFESRPLSRRDNEYMSENEHDRAYAAERARIMPHLQPILKNPAIDNWDLEAGEKGHLTLYVNLK